MQDIENRIFSARIVVCRQQDVIGLILVCRLRSVSFFLECAVGGAALCIENAVIERLQLRLADRRVFGDRAHIALCRNHRLRKFRDLAEQILHEPVDIGLIDVSVTVDIRHFLHAVIGKFILDALLCVGEIGSVDHAVAVHITELIDRRLCDTCGFFDDDIIHIKIAFIGIRFDVQCRGGAAFYGVFFTGKRPPCAGRDSLLNKGIILRAVAGAVLYGHLEFDG